jgi:hypothetical protein
MEVPGNFYVYPRLANTVMDASEYRGILKSTEGYILTHGCLWDIVGKDLGAGMYRVSLKRRSYDGR